MRLPNWVGDTVLATPALRALRRRFPRAALAVAGGAHLTSLLGGGDLFDESAALARGASRAERRANVRALAALHADLAVILPHSFRSAWEVFRAGVPSRAGYRREGRGWLLTESLRPHRIEGRIVPVPMVFQYLELVALLGASGDGAGPALPVSDGARGAAERELLRLGHRAGERLIALNPGASFGPSKVWPIAYLAEVADALQREAGTRAIILCGPGEEGLARELRSRMTTPPLDMAGAPLPLDTTKAVLERAALLITTDTGPRHIAVAVGTPALVLMGPTDPRYTHSHLGPSLVLRRDVPCGPCHLKVCPLDHRCMREILPADVLLAARHLLERCAAKPERVPAERPADRA